MNVLEAFNPQNVAVVRRGYVSLKQGMDRSKGLVRSEIKALRHCSLLTARLLQQRLDVHLQGLAHGLVA